MTRLSTTQEEMIATLRRIGEPTTLEEIVKDIRERVKDGDAHRATFTELKPLIKEWFDLKSLGRIRRVVDKADEKKGRYRWELVPRVEFIEDECKTSEET